MNQLFFSTKKNTTTNASKRKFAPSGLAVSLGSVLVCMTMHGSLHAQTSSNLISAYQAALQHDAGFASAKASLAASQEKVVQAKTANLPTVNLGGSSNWAKQDIIGIQIGDRSYTNASVNLSANYPLWRPAIADGISQAQLGVRLAEASFANAQQDLLTRVAQAYFDVLLAQDNVTTIATQKAAIAEQLAQAKREFEVGTKTILDTNEAQARYDLTLAQEAVAAGELLSKRAALELLTGVNAEQFAKLSPSTQVPAASPSDLSAWTTRAQEGSIAVQSAQLSADIAKLEVSRNQKINGASVDLVSNMSAIRNLGSASSAAYATVGSVGFGVQISYPIYNGGNLNSKVREAMLSHDKSLSDLENAKRNAAQQARQAYLSLSYGISQIKALESAVRSSQTLLDSTKLGYQVGVRINLDVLNAQQALANNTKDLSKARYDALMSGLRLKAATAQLSEADLNAVNNQLQLQLQ